MAPTRVFITGATGTQGNATVRAVIKHATDTNPITIHALVRDPESGKAQSLKSISNANASIKLFRGTFDDVDSIKAASAECTGAFINVLPSLDPSDPNAESRHASNILTALAATPTINRVVYPSVNGLADPSIPGNFVNIEPGNWMYGYFVSKFNIQESIRKTAEEKGWQYTILQPSYFLTNFLAPIASFMFPEMAGSERKIVTAFPRGHRLSYIDPDDTGRFAAAVFMADEKEMSERWNGAKVPLGSVNVSLEDVVGVMNKVLGFSEDENIEVVNLDLAEAREQSKMNPLLGSQVMQVDNPKLVDVEKVKSYGIELGGVEEFFVKNRQALEDAVGLRKP